MVLKFILYTCAFFSVASATIRFLTDDGDTGNIFVFENDPDKFYYASTTPAKEIHIFGVAGSQHDSYSPVTSIRTSSSPISRVFLETQFDAFKHMDEVWSENFLSTLFISFEREDVRGWFDESGKQWLLDNGVKNVYINDRMETPVWKKLNNIVIREVNDLPPHGPWLLRCAVKDRNSVSAYPVYGLMEDEHQAFTVGAIPNIGHSGYMRTNITLKSNPNIQFIPIPSRMSAWSGRTLPLAGMRFAVKDIFDVKGLATGAGSHAYRKALGQVEETAPSIQRLLDLGASIVGKTRTSQFAHGAQPWEYADFEYSWNPRGDGYLTAGASSSGSASAIAAYDWIDFAVGSDTRGSIRKPAALVGAFGLRPSHGTLDMKGVVPLSEEMDTAGVFARDYIIFEALGRNWYANSDIINRRPTLRLPKNLLYPIDHFPLQNPDAQMFIERFKHHLRKHLNIVPKPINMTDTLTPHFPSQSFEKFHTMSNRLVEWRSWQSVGKPLYRAYAQKFGAEELIDFELDPVPHRMFKKGKQLTQSDFVEALAAKRKFEEALNEEVFPFHAKTCSDSIFMYDASTGGRPSFRVEEMNTFEDATQLVLTSPATGTNDEEPTEPKLEHFLHYVGSMGGLPEVTIPLGQVQYKSPVTGKLEYMPVAVQLATRKGCDGVLYELVKELGDKGVIKSVLAGKEAYEVDTTTKKKKWV
ncbi:hypothetical protein AGABI1DRAFT_113062 [Agaricus bisporus var. burnettii JB137-S8]|uniref:Uncharacterized protein n=1 Tax=Agaricus bisporus var. burnettii (strain JB137-S8 / ATCC MYA-4627 / FGSC 10392) TaxID=597362 RepID=K5X970_AGABU|nr:uncharacterized protein AGABI1DRAFT_113062 [Agaricus bisporus var. burnettii JB137-S8]EKM79758.1 hypothetical protein AGABI1DRAFT_113062 [Agaricus bisporus var. burnettii JB137-S8]